MGWIKRKMADVLNATTVHDRAKVKVSEELHIVESETRSVVWNDLSRNGDIFRTIEVLVRKYNDLRETESRKKSSMYADFTVDFFSDLRSTFQSSSIYRIDKFSKEDLHAVFNFLAHIVFVCGQSLGEKKIDHGVTQQQQTFELKDEPSTSNEAFKSSSSIIRKETTRGLLSLGGGCIGEIWKVQKRRKVNENLSNEQRKQAEILYNLTFKLKMTSEEKKQDCVPVGLRIRDRGGLFIPKMEFLPFLQATIDTVMKYANNESFQKYGKGMLKVCMTEIRNTVCLWSLFEEVCEDLIPEVSKIDKKLFFNEWLRKLTHARLAEFIKANTQNTSEKAGKRLKGGQTLRDKLYALSGKRKAKSVPVKLKKSTTLKTKGNTVKKANKRKRRKKEVQDSEVPSTSAVSAPPIQRTVSKRKKIRSRLLDEFVD